MRSKHLLYVLVFLFLVVFDDIAMAANTSEFVGWGGRFTAMGGASTALSGEPSCMVTNPAGIAEHNGKNSRRLCGWEYSWNVPF